jgi:hypothetical protein
MENEKERGKEGVMEVRMYRVEVTVAVRGVKEGTVAVRGVRVKEGMVFEFPLYILDVRELFQVC